ncbi:hypothetical protein IWZ03DRAFT_428889 [Phyllosticta citriasiana]|uniref:Uncharacterized protein n=1 Tax=Phyllosticta citriasiana TaxID=595635 RepID=A0ABR1KYV5_9PEZI
MIHRNPCVVDADVGAATTVFLLVHIDIDTVLRLDIDFPIPVHVHSNAWELRIAPLRPVNLNTLFIDADVGAATTVFLLVHIDIDTVLRLDIDFPIPVHVHSNAWELRIAPLRPVNLNTLFIDADVGAATTVFLLVHIDIDTVLRLDIDFPIPVHVHSNAWELRIAPLRPVNLDTLFVDADIGAFATISLWVHIDFNSTLRLEVDIPLLVDFEANAWELASFVLNWAGGSESREGGQQRKILDHFEEQLNAGVNVKYLMWCKGQGLSKENSGS